DAGRDSTIAGKKIFFLNGSLKWVIPVVDQHIRAAKDERIHPGLIRKTFWKGASDGYPHKRLVVGSVQCKLQHAHQRGPWRFRFGYRPVHAVHIVANALLRRSAGV